MSIINHIYIMKKFTLLLILLLSIFARVDASAQHYLKKRTVGAVEGQIGIGLATAANSIAAFGDSRQGVDVDVEVRYNFAALPFDLGLNFSICAINRGEQNATVAKYFQFGSRSLMATTHYNFLQTHNVSPFVGIGAGVAWCDLSKTGSKGSVHPIFAPQVGVEIFDRLRVSISYKLYEKANNHLVVGVGFVVGGKKR